MEKIDIYAKNGLSDKWIYFLKEATSLDSIPEILGEVLEIEKALNIANKINMTAEELDIVDRRGMLMQDERGRITYAKQQGEQRGEQKGRAQLVIRLIKKRFGEIPEAIISQIEDLSVVDLDNLGEDFLDFNSLEYLLSWLQER
ncbi:DUF4351 domain-containing protein [Okeania sp. SIO1I7]|uniref:DUF4351 domain-containing protein n=1 Tax=Okeania sp. SIO1I7 TaxID=2607772 RepID=UPI0025EBCCAD|nr:DUF4351 domain-containing protein [Okeania sp. SIO1I7]